MKLSTKQIQMLHTVPHRLGITDAERRLIQVNIGGFHSCADRTVTREGLIAVMAFYEVRAGGRLPRFTAGYWRQQDAIAKPGDALVYRIGIEAKRLALSPAQLDAFIAGDHMSAGKCTAVTADADPYWLRRCLQGLLAIRTRTARLSPACPAGRSPQAADRSTA